MQYQQPQQQNYNQPQNNYQQPPQQQYQQNNMQQGQPQMQQNYPPQQIQLQPMNMGVAIQMVGPGSPSNANNVKFPIQVLCPSCSQNAVTRIEHKFGGWTCCMIGSLAIFSLCLAFIPCCLDECRDKYHHCGNCSQVVGIHEYVPCSRS